jgi:hypothetical protein
MATITLPKKLTASQIKALSDKAKAKITTQVDKIVAKGHMIDDIDLNSDDYRLSDRRAFQIPIFHYEPDVTGLSVRRRSSGTVVRGERSMAVAVVKKAREVVKAMNLGQDLGPMVLVPTGRPRGRQKATT